MILIEYENSFWRWEICKKKIRKKEAVLSYAIKKNFSNWLIKEIKERYEDSDAIELAYDLIEKDDFYPIKANNVFSI